MGIGDILFDCLVQYYEYLTWEDCYDIEEHREFLYQMTAQLYGIDSKGILPAGVTINMEDIRDEVDTRLTLIAHLKNRDDTYYKTLRHLEDKDYWIPDAIEELLYRSCESDSDE